MTETPLTPELFAQVGFCDAQLQSLSWIEGGRDLRIFFSHASGKEFSLVFAWARHLSLNLQSAPSLGGYPLTWSGRLEACETGLSVAFDFAGSGTISLTCSSAFIESIA